MGGAAVAWATKAQRWARAPRSSATPQWSAISRIGGISVARIETSRAVMRAVHFPHRAPPVGSPLGLALEVHVHALVLAESPALRAAALSGRPRPGPTIVLVSAVRRDSAAVWARGLQEANPFTPGLSALLWCCVSLSHPSLDGESRPADRSYSHLP
jgi:hypothetical protein